MLERQKSGKLSSQASEPHVKMSLTAYSFNISRKLNVMQNGETLLSQEEHHYYIRKPDINENFPSNIEGESQERLFQGRSEGSSPSNVRGGPRRIAHVRKCCVPPTKISKRHVDFSQGWKEMNIKSDPADGLVKVKDKLFRSVISISSQCLVIAVSAMLLLSGEGADAYQPSCFKCGLRPSQSHRRSFEERLTTPRQEARVKAPDLTDDFPSTAGPYDLQTESPRLNLQPSQGPTEEGGHMGQLCGPRLSCGPGLECRYSVPGTLGVCREAQKLPCAVNGTTYDDGATFHPDCRTECTCTGGTYACVSLCPEEELPPSAACRNPALQTSGRRCCRQWTCDPDPDTLDPESPQCEVSVSRWSACSSLTCGLGLSQRWATDQVSCRPVLQTRLCQLRPCRAVPEVAPRRQLRRSHHCKATIRAEKPQRLVAGPCVSQRMYRVKRCNTCPGSCCSDFMDTSIEVPFMCPLHSVPPYLLGDSSLSPVDQASLFDSVTDSDTQEGKLGDLTVSRDDEYTNVTAANYEVIVKQVQWIVRCRCTPTCETPQLLSTTSTPLDPTFNFGES